MYYVLRDLNQSKLPICYEPHCKRLNARQPPMWLAYLGRSSLLELLDRLPTNEKILETLQNALFHFYSELDEHTFIWII